MTQLIIAFNVFKSKGPTVQSASVGITLTLILNAKLVLPTASSVSLLIYVMHVLLDIPCLMAILKDSVFSVSLPAFSA